MSTVLMAGVIFHSSGVNSLDDVDNAAKLVPYMYEKEDIARTVDSALNAIRVGEWDRFRDILCLTEDTPLDTSALGEELRRKDEEPV